MLALTIVAQKCPSYAPQSFNATGEISDNDNPGNLTRYITSRATFTSVTDILDYSLATYVPFSSLRNIS